MSRIDRKVFITANEVSTGILQLSVVWLENQGQFDVCAPDLFGSLS